MKASIFHGVLLILYIPIWFYSNKSRDRRSWLNIKLYIPIWFYSNSIVRWNSITIVTFTFQSGSIQILPLLVFTVSTSTLYIPIWFYSNGVSQSTVHAYLVLYIPIWFYSNTVKRGKQKPPTWTLHSNLVLFKWRKWSRIRHHRVPLHSNLVLFK